MSLPVIAVAVDFKDLTSYVIKTGLFIAEKVYGSCRVILFHVIEYFLSPPAYVLPYLEEERKLIDLQLRVLVDSFQRNQIKIETKVLLGNFWEALNNFISDTDPELLVLGYVTHKLKIPTAEKILEKLEVNFLVVKNRSLNRLETIACLIDFSEVSERCLKTALFFSKKTSARIKCLNIIPKIRPSLPSEIKDKMLEEEKEKRQRAWEHIKEKLALESMKAELSLDIFIGDELDVLRDFIETYEVDLIILGKRGKMIKTGLGSFSKEVIRKSEIPVLLVK